jgi:predicted PurR-regulated permease PerM
MLMVLIFFLLGAPALATRLKTGFPAGNPTLARFRELAGDLREYVRITTWINLLVGLVNTIFLFILGVDYALLWGLLSFLMGYIPNVGFWIALIPPFLLALLEFGVAKALIVLTGYVLINGGVQNFLQPRMMGSGLNLSPLVVILSLFFWGWVLGPMGALLAVPLTMIVKEVFLDAYDDTRGLSELMSADSPVTEPLPDVPAKSTGEICGQNSVHAAKSLRRHRFCTGPIALICSHCAINNSSAALDLYIPFFALRPSSAGW